jgi:hypothetical protein
MNASDQIEEDTVHRRCREGEDYVLFPPLLDSHGDPGPVYNDSVRELNLLLHIPK